MTGRTTGKTAPPRKAKLIPAADVFAEWRAETGYAEAFDDLEEEFAIMAALIKARTDASLSQSEIARRMNTTQSAIARLEAGGHRASLRTLRHYAEATGHRVRISLEPLPKAASGRRTRPRPR